MAPSQRTVDAAYASAGTGVLLMAVAVWSIMNEISNKCGKNEKHGKNVDWLFFISLGTGAMTLLWELFGSGSVSSSLWMFVSVILAATVIVGATLGINSYNKCDKEKKKKVCAKDKNYLIVMLSLTLILAVMVPFVKKIY